MGNAAKTPCYKRGEGCTGQGRKRRKKGREIYKVCHWEELDPRPLLALRSSAVSFTSFHGSHSKKQTKCSLSSFQWLLMCFSVMSRNRDPATTSICMHSAPAAWLDVSAPFFSPSPPAAVQFLTIGSNNSFSPTSSSSFQDSRLDCLLDMQSPPDPDSPSSRCGRRGLEFPQ